MILALFSGEPKSEGETLVSSVIPSDFSDLVGSTSVMQIHGNEFLFPYEI